VDPPSLFKNGGISKGLLFLVWQWGGGGERKGGVPGAGVRKGDFPSEKNRKSGEREGGNGEHEKHTN